MKSALVLAAALAVTAVQVTAMQTVTDADGNGAYSMDEMLVGYPDLTDQIFADIDADDSGDVSEEELIAAVENGMLDE